MRVAVNKMHMKVHSQTLMLTYINLVVSFWTSCTRGQLFDYGCMSNPDVFSCEPGPHNEPMKGLLHLSLCLQSFSSLLFYGALVTAGRDWFSYLFPVASYSLAVTVGRSHTNTFIHLRSHVHTHSSSGAVGSMQKSHLIVLWLTNLLFVLVHNEVCVVNRNGRSVIDAQREHAPHQNTGSLEAIWRLHAVCASYIFYMSVSLSVRENLGCW